jgi:hypothetical protein
MSDNTQNPENPTTTQRPDAKNEQKPQNPKPVFKLLLNQPHAVECVTAEARAWLCSPLPNAYAPIRFIGWRTLEKMSEILGRAVTLEEAHFIVQFDGDQTRCQGTGDLFQPIKFWPHCPHTFKEDIAAGKTVKDIDIPFGGCFFNQKGQVVAFSGPVFNTYGRDIDQTSNLNIAVEMASQANQNGRRIEWGRARSIVEGWLRTTSEREKDLRDRTISIATSFGVKINLEDGNMPRGMRPVLLRKLAA